MPFLAVIISMAFGAAFGTLIYGTSFQPRGGDDTVIGRFSRTYWRSLAFLDLVAMCVVVRFVPEPRCWLLVAVLMMPLASLTTNFSVLAALVPNRVVRLSLLEFPLVVAALAFAQGRVHADDLIKGEGPLLVDVVGSSLQLKFDATHPVSYVGHIADFFVLYDSAQSQVVLLNDQKVNSLALTRNPKAAF